MIDLTANGSSHYFTVADDAAFALSDSEAWSLFVWCFWPSGSLAGTLFQYFVSQGTFDANPNINIFAGEDSGASANQFTASMKGASSTLSVTNIDNGKPWLLRFRHTTTNQWALYACQPGDTSVQAGSVRGPTSGGNDATGNVNFGRRADGNTARYMQGHMGEVFVMSGAYSAADHVALANGAHYLDVLSRYTMRFYWPAYQDVGANQKDWIAGLAVTRNGTPGSAAHAPIIGPWLHSSINRSVAAAAGIVFPLVRESYGHRIVIA